MLILAAAFTGLRWGELIALRRCDLDFTGRVVRVYRRLAEHRDGEMEAGPTKSLAERAPCPCRTCSSWHCGEHLAEFAEDGSEGLVFVGERGGPLRRGTFHRSTAWTATVVKAAPPAGSTSTTYGTPATTSPPLQVPAPGS